MWKKIIGIWFWWTFVVLSFLYFECMENLNYFNTILKTTQTSKTEKFEFSYNSGHPPSGQMTWKPFSALNSNYLGTLTNSLIFCIYFSWQYHHGHYFEISQFTGKKRDRTQSLWNRKGKRKNEKFYLFILFCWRAHFLLKINWAWCFLRNNPNLFILELLKEFFQKHWFKHHYCLIQFVKQNSPFVTQDKQMPLFFGNPFFLQFFYSLFAIIQSTFFRLIWRTALTT